MDMSSGEMQQSQGGEQMPGLHVVEFDREQLKHNRPEMAKWLRYRLNDNDNDASSSASERKEILKGVGKTLRHNELHSGESELVLAAMDGEKIVGLLTVEMTEAGKKAEIGELWTKFRDHRSQRAVALKLLAFAKGRLNEEHFRRLTASVESPHNPLSVASGKPALQYFLKTDSELPANDNSEPQKDAA